MKKLRFLMFFAAFAVLAAGCNTEKVNGNKTAFGVDFEIHEKGSGKQVEVGDFVTFHLIQKNQNDSVFFSSFEREPIVIQVTQPMNYGDPNGWIASLSEGDSATFTVAADSIYVNGIQAPDIVKQGEKVKFVIKVNEALTETAFMQKRHSKDFELTNTQIQQFEDHLASNQITNYVKSEEGFIYVVQQEGKGPKPKAGDMLNVHYTLKLIDGTRLESSKDRNEPFAFRLGHGMVIQGWEKAMPQLNIGSKATLYIPSPLAYEDRGTPNIAPNTPLVFEVELLEIVTPESQLRSDVKKIEDHLKKNNIKAQKTADNIYYTVERKGTGDMPKPGQQVEVHYTGKLLNGTVFDSSVERNQAFSFVIGQGQVIQGWEKGIPLFAKGGKGTIYLPSALAYGDRNMGVITPNSVLIFEIEVLDIKN